MKSLSKWVFYVVGILVLFFYAGRAAAAQVWPGVRQPQLEAKLPTPNQVYCSTTRPPSAPVAVGWTWIGVHEIYLIQEICDELKSDVYPYAYMVLYHEWWHQAFREYNESNTNTGALAVLRYALRHYWSFPDWKAQTFYEYLYPLPYAAGYENHLTFTNPDPLIEEGF